MATPSPPPPAPPPLESTTSPPDPAPAATPTPPTTTTTTTTTAPPPSGAAVGTSGTGFPFPREWHFPPFFTRQPNATTRHAQHDKWAALVLAYCAHHRLYRLSLPSPTSSSSSSLWDDPYGGGGVGASTAAAAATTPGAHDLFHNRRLRRSLSRADAREVFEHMRAAGRAEPVGSAASASTGSYSLSGVFGGGGGGGSSSSGVEDYYRSSGGGGGGSGDMGGGGLGDNGSAAATAAGAAAAMGPLSAGAAAGAAATGAGAAAPLSSGPVAAGDGGGAYWVYWRTPDEWARAVEAWVEDTAQRGVVFTLYELTRGEDTRGAEFHGLDPELLQKALQILVKRGKAQIFGQEDSRGVKFF